MGLLINGTKYGKPYINSVKHNAFLNGQKVWSNSSGPNYLTFTSDTDMTIAVKRPSTGTVEYSLDGTTWIDLPYRFAPTPVTASGRTISFRGKITGNQWFTTNIQSDNAWVINGGTNVRISGNIQTLLDYENPPDSVGQNCFSYIFYNNSSITDASNLLVPATTLATYCYRGMFYYCTSLVSAPAILPATTLASACYIYMFSGCSLLVNAPELPATTLASNCYSYMFRNCILLVNAPALPATTLASNCYSYMFQSCDSLVNAPALPATTLAQSCYIYMFSGCSLLVNAPELPATTLASNCYSYMFRNCTSLVTAPLLPAPTLVINCYNMMFYGCNNLANMSVRFTVWPTDSTTNAWMQGSVASGTFECPAALPNSRGINWIPTGWTKVDI